MKRREDRNGLSFKNLLDISKIYKTFPGFEKKSRHSKFSWPYTLENIPGGKQKSQWQIGIDQNIIFKLRENSVHKKINYSKM